MAIEIISERLHLRQWKDADREPYAALNMDPVVMRFFPSLQSREGSDFDIERWGAELDDRGWSNWAVETRASGRFIGYIVSGSPSHLVGRREACVDAWIRPVASCEAGARRCGCSDAWAAA